MTTTPEVPAVDIEAEANRQLHRRIAGWLMWPLSVAAAFAVGFAVVGQHTTAHGSTPPAVGTPLATSGAHTAPHVTPKPSPTVAPATTTVDAPAPPRHGKTKVVQSTDTVAPAATTATKPPAAQAPAPPTQPAPTTAPAATSPPPVLSLCLGKLLHLGC